MDAQGIKRFFFVFINCWLAVVIYAIIIFLISSVPGRDIPSLFSFQDVVFHIIEFGILSLLVNRAISRQNRNLGFVRRFLFVVIICLVYAMSDELHQGFVPGRDSSFIDFGYDSIGIILVSLVYP